MHHPKNPIIPLKLRIRHRNRNLRALRKTCLPLGTTIEIDLIFNEFESTKGALMFHGIQTFFAPKKLTTKTRKKKHELDKSQSVLAHRS